MHYFIVLLSLFASAFAQEYTLELFLNGESIPFEVESGTLESLSDLTTITFEGGKLELNLADWNTFNLAHVLATTFEKTAENTYTVSATVRHNDIGWDNYADAFEVKGGPVQNNTVQNGLRVLAHPHETEQPFTRSQSGVVASGLVWVEAKDNVEGTPGSKIYLDLAHPNFANQSVIEVRYELK
jgi:hypothetical protein